MKLTNDWLIETRQGIQHCKTVSSRTTQIREFFQPWQYLQLTSRWYGSTKGPKFSYHQWSNFTSCYDKNAVFIFFHICKSLVWLEPLYKIKLLVFPIHSWKRKGLGWLHCKQSSVSKKRTMQKITSDMVILQSVLANCTKQWHLSNVQRNFLLIYLKDNFNTVQ